MERAFARCCYAMLSSFLVLPLVVPTASAALTGADLHAQIERSLKAEGLTGAVWSLVHADGTITTDAAGLKNARTGELLSAHHRVHVGSVAKTLIAVGILRLARKGRLALDTPVAEVLENLPLDNPWQPTSPLIVRHLLDHTSGLDDARLWQIFSLTSGPDTPLSEAFRRDPTVLRVRVRPGTRLSYSNMGYGLLGMTIEAMSGERYESHLDKHLLAPLGMRDSTFSFVSQTGAHADARLAMGHFENGVTHPAVPVYLRTPTQFTTTANDMALFSRFLMSDGRIQDKPFIDESLLQAMGRPFRTEAALAGLQAGYGLGLSRRDRYGVIGRCHTGNIVGYRASLCLFPEQHKAFFIAMNTDSETADYARFDSLLVQALDLLPTARSSAATHTSHFDEWNGIYIPAPNRFSRFEWLDTLFSFIHVRWDGAHLNLKPFQSTNRVLIHERDLLFRATDHISASHVLLTTADGKRVLSDGRQSFERVSLWKIVPLWVNFLIGMMGLLYIFLSGLTRLISMRLSRSHPMLLPFLAVAALLVPIPLFFRQSFLQLGDVTAASVTLAVVTAFLPAAMLIGLSIHLRRHCSSAVQVVDSIATAAVLQLTIVLIAWNLLPLRLWV
jgi:CubicO group peptidase (beta-lactamase class C family)